VDFSLKLGEHFFMSAADKVALQLEKLEL